MTPEEFDWGAIVTVSVALIGFAGVVVTKRVQKGTRENTLIDQLQEQIESMKAEHAADKEARRLERIEQAKDQETRRLERIEDHRRMSKIEQRDRVYIPHILKLNRHIDQNLGPPAPPVPNPVQEYLDEEQT
ncbi:hypothetical protein [Pseudarthrobacter sp. PS3-L1]|uniref:hypothetical protein n=1 Tax=Pseudarthrobacter sp. PS3-L1 TaxID=3046207 RepID=UPI0024B9B78E|nr:hypothetical protein [Pseudarthrobacter sp. PS3-L1]MDJ0321646.1 hypothetical protein [Pseudarthrobacter sp. PS3-L1]